MRLLRRAFLALPLLALAACASIRDYIANEPDPPPPPILILVSIDGFRPDYLDRGVTPTLSALAHGGVRASMRPSFPSLTFPNHVTLVTGRRPDRHGVVNNWMQDPQIPGVTFALRARNVVADPRWWDETNPIWNTAERQGVRTATMFWPGSDVEIHGRMPSQWRLFNMQTPNTERVDQVLAWLSEPEPPRFLTLYFDTVDTAGHEYGPDAEETNQALRDADEQITRLVRGVEERGLQARVNYLIVSDHGMAAISPDRLVDVDALLGGGAARIVTGGALAGIEPLAERQSVVEIALIGRHPHMECWRKDALPARFHFGSHRRIPPILCLADPGWHIVSRQLPPYLREGGGAHGFDPADPSMAALFIAYGPAFRPGATLPDFDNIHLYPLMTGLLGIEPEANEGDPAILAPALAPPPETP